MNRQQRRAQERENLKRHGAEKLFYATVQAEVELSICANSHGMARSVVKSLPHADHAPQGADVVRWFSIDDITEGPYTEGERARLLEMLAPELDRQLDVADQPGPLQTTDAQKAYNAILRASDTVTTVDLGSFLDAVRNVAGNSHSSGWERLVRLVEAARALRDAQWDFYAGGRIDDALDEEWVRIEDSM